VFDGDLVLVVDNKTMMSGVSRDGVPVIDVDDKATVLAEAHTKDAVLALILRNFNSLIGEASNAATTFHSIKANTPEQAKRYQDYIATLSIVTGKSIDFAKTGVMFNIPRHIAKYAKPLPYFMKYRSDYYQGLKKFRNNNCNMNMLCRTIERWEKIVLRNKLPNDARYHTERNISFVGRGKRFDHTIMQNLDIAYTVDEYSQIEKLFLDFCSNIAELAQEQYRLRHYTEYKAWIEDNFPTMKKEDATWYTVDWQYYYNSYRLACRHICPEPEKLANIVVDLVYRKHKNKNRNFLWIVASEGVLINLQQCQVSLPKLDDEGEIDILGKKYKMEVVFDD
jgi:hypothetical protein